MQLFVMTLVEHVFSQYIIIICWYMIRAQYKWNRIANIKNTVHTTTRWLYASQRKLTRDVPRGSRTVYSLFPRIPRAGHAKCVCVCVCESEYTLHHNQTGIAQTYKYTHISTHIHTPINVNLLLVVICSTDGVRRLSWSHYSLNFACWCMHTEWERQS